MHERRAMASRLAALVLVALLLVPLSGAPPARAIVSTSIAIDGNMADWSPVFMDPANAMADRVGADDPDNPGTQSRDLSLVAYTWDSTYVYFYFRRTTQGTNSVAYYVYIDRDFDGLLKNADMVASYFFNGTKFAGAALNYYSAKNNTTGDTLGSDGVTPPGGTGGTVASTGMTGASASNGIETEARVRWADLGLAPGSPVNLHFACGRSSGLPSAIEDNTNNLTSRYRAVSVTPDNDSGAKAGATINYAHTVSNGGNGAEVFDLTATSSQGWTTTIKNAGGTQISSVTLRGGESTTVVVSLQVPATAPDTARDVTLLRAVCRADLNVAGQAKDETMVGLITVSPYRQGAMAQSGVISYSHTLSNNTSSAATIDLSATSAHGWPIGIYDASGKNPLGSILLSAGATTTIVCKMTVPVGTAIGTTDVGTVQAVLESNPSERGTAYDEVTVQKEVSISPDNAGPGGSGTIVSYTHTVTNSWSTQRTLNLAGVSSRGWTVNIYDSDATTKITSVTLAPFGGSRTIYVRITIPAGTAVGVADTTAITASFGTASDTARDVTTVSNLALFDSPGYSVPTTSFQPGDTIYARGMGLASGSQVQFRWLDPSGATVTQTPLLGVDVTQMVSTSYTLPATATNGTWTCVLLNNGGTEIARVPFTVSVPQFLTLTIDVPSLDFGTLDPATPSPPQNIAVTVSSSAPYQLSSSSAGQAAQMGLAVSGTAHGLQPKGTGYFFDSYQVDIPWTTDPQTPLSATVTYTAIQQ